MRLKVTLVALISAVKRARSLSCALNPLTTRRPKSVSSMDERISAFCSCPRVEARLRDRPRRPMRNTATGMSSKTKSVSCQEITSNVTRYTRIMIGSLKSISRADMIDASTSPTSFVMREMTSPRRASVKYPIGRERTLLYSSCLRSRRTPVRIGTIK